MQSDRKTTGSQSFDPVLGLKNPHKLNNRQQISIILMIIFSIKFDKV